MHTDASSTGLGAVLYQKQDGKDRVIAYASHGLNRSEMNYPAHKLKVFVSKMGSYQKVSRLLYGKKFTVITDNNPLTYVLPSAKLDATGHRWVTALAAFDFEINYRPGRNIADADSLSRLKESQQLDRIPISIDNVKTIASISMVQTPSPLIESLSIDSDAL